MKNFFVTLMVLLITAALVIPAEAATTKKQTAKKDAIKKNIVKKNSAKHVTKTAAQKPTAKKSDPSVDQANLKVKPFTKAAIAKNNATNSEEEPNVFDLLALEDAQPRWEPLSGSANRPYTVMGNTFFPLKADEYYKATGYASWYGRRFHGRRTASGEVYDMHVMSAAHPTLPIPSYVRVTNLSNNESVVVRVNDRGPFFANRLIDLSYAAAVKLGLVEQGSGQVEVERLFPTDPMPENWVQKNTTDAMALASLKRWGELDAIDDGAVVVDDSAASDATGPSKITQNKQTKTNTTARSEIIEETKTEPARDPARKTPEAPVTSEPVKESSLTISSTSDKGAARPSKAASLEGVQSPPQKATSPKTNSSDKTSRQFFIQVAALKSQSSARSLIQKALDDLKWKSHRGVIKEEQGLYKVRFGPYTDREQAQRHSKALAQSLNMKPILVARN